MKWRWHWKDFGYRFSVGGRGPQDFYEGLVDGDYYAIPKRHRKVGKDVIELYYNSAKTPTGFRTVACPWRDYDRQWDEVLDAEGWPLNYAGCLDHEEVHRQEDIGVARAWEHILALSDDTPVTVELMRNLHRELMGEIYPFAGEWRTVSLAKGTGFWPMPPGGISGQLERLERDLFSKTPYYTLDVDLLCTFVAELVNEILAVHPFREGNGRTVRALGSLVFLQNDQPPLSEWDRGRDEVAYIQACEAGRARADHAPLAAVLRRWLNSARQRAGA